MQKNGLICCIATACFVLAALPAFAQPYPDSAQFSTLETWKKQARTSPLGYPLVELLNSCNENLKRNPRDKKSYYQRGYLLGVLGCTSWAIADLSSAIEIDPCYSAAYTERGICYMDVGNLPLALADLDRSVYLNPRSGDAHFARGRVLLQLHRTAQARNEFANCDTMQFAPALPGELPGNYYDAPDYYLGVCMEALGNTDSALNYYKRALRGAQRYGGSGYLHRYADQPQDAHVKIANHEPDYQQ